MRCLFISFISTEVHQLHDSLQLSSGGISRAKVVGRQIGNEVRQLQKRVAEQERVLGVSSHIEGGQKNTETPQRYVQTLFAAPIGDIWGQYLICMRLICISPCHHITISPNLFRVLEVNVCKEPTASAKFLISGLLPAVLRGHIEA